MKKILWKIISILSSLTEKLWDDDAEYSRPPEIQEERGFKDTMIPLKDLNLSYNQKFLHVYDYGNVLTCDIHVIGIGIYNEKKNYPHVIRKSI